MNKKAAAFLTFSPTDNGNCKIPPGPIWYTSTYGIEPNNWSIKIYYLQPIQNDSTVIAQISFLMPEADHLLITGNEFKLFGGYDQFKCSVKIIQEL